MHRFSSLDLIDLQQCAASVWLFGELSILGFLQRRQEAIDWWWRPCHFNYDPMAYLGCIFTFISLFELAPAQHVSGQNKAEQQRTGPTQQGRVLQAQWLTQPAGKGVRVRSTQRTWAVIQKPSWRWQFSVGCKLKENPLQHFILFRFKDQGFHLKKNLEYLNSPFIVFLIQKQALWDLHMYAGF